MKKILSRCPNSTILEGLRANDLSNIEPWLKKIDIIK